MVLNFGEKQEDDEAEPIGKQWQPGNGAGSGNSTPHGGANGASVGSKDSSNFSNVGYGMENNLMTDVPSQQAATDEFEEEEQLFEKINVIKDTQKKGMNSG